ncbi:hypothetical protein HPB51_010116 [Rhipicephalus microplus]|uniref:L-carnitine dehydratase/alpha-methylacyl-coa racemase n=1 Tax=Rhipicephalus microplus TaxID=6941 RepID=A0A9J6F2G7_RHIMP|nr:hypothetical protein HPB51_010116 [Rhipicephalus microplus]
MALKGIRVLEMAGLAPAPFCGMLLRDFGASVIRIDRPEPQLDADRLGRGKRSIMIDLGKKKGADLLLKMAKKSDVLLEGYRPGVLSMLGAYGQKPQPPVNLMADFAGGGLLCALGICMALLERERSGKGQVIDASMASDASTEGCAYVSTFLWRTRSSKMALPIWIDERGGNILDGGAHFYNVYETKDGKYMAVGALEPHFYKILAWVWIRRKCHSSPSGTSARQVFADAFKRKTQAEWCCRVRPDGLAARCPCWTYDKVSEHQHNAHRGAFIECKDGPPVPRPAPLLLRTPAEPDMEEPLIGEHTRQILQEVLGIGDAEVQKLIDDNVVAAPTYKLKSKL